MLSHDAGDDDLLARSAYPPFRVDRVFSLVAIRVEAVFSALVDCVPDGMAFLAKQAMRRLPVLCAEEAYPVLLAGFVSLPRGFRPSSFLLIGGRLPVLFPCLSCPVARLAERAMDSLAVRGAQLTKAFGVSSLAKLS